MATVSSIDGENLLLYRAAGTLVLAEKPPGEGWFALQQQTGFFDRALRLRSPLIRRALAHAHAANHAQRSRAYSSEAFAILAAHPFAYVKLAASGVVALWLEDFAWPLTEAGVPRRLSYALFVPMSLLLICLAVYGIGRVDFDLALLIAVTIAYFTIISAGAEAHPRFTIPYLPPYAIAIGAGVSAAVQRVARGSRFARPRNASRSAPPHTAQ
ncbi:MAG TPA: hypothetical protein VI391_09360 [Thermoanaerobaculia bacterium]